MKLFRKKDKVGGYIAYYNLEDWWFSTFTEEERKLIDELYSPMGGGTHSLTQGDISFSSGKLDTFLNGLATWFRSKEHASIADRIHAKVEEVGRSQPVEAPGYVEGRHFSTFVDDILTLKREGKVEEVETLLYKLVDATEAESNANGWGVAPAYYEHLAILYSKQKEYEKEIAILERFAKQKHAPGVLPPRLLERLEKAKKKLSAST